MSYIENSRRNFSDQKFFPVMILPQTPGMTGDTIVIGPHLVLRTSPEDWVRFVWI